MLKPLRTIVLTAVAGLAFSLQSPAQNIFVRVTNNTSATAPVNIDSPLGRGVGTWQYSAVAPVAGTTWNTMRSVTASALTAGQTGNPNTGSTPGDYNLYASPISLVDSSGAATGVTLQMISHYAGTTLAGSTRESIQYINQTAAANSTDPGGLTGIAWRDQNNSGTGPNTTWEFVMAGLTSGSLYDLYFYGTGNQTSQGITVTLGVLNGGASSSTLGLAPPISIYLPDYSGPVDATNGWNVVQGTVDVNGEFRFTAERNPTGSFFFNGFQLVEAVVPEPAAAAILGLGTLLVISRFRRKS